MSVLALKVSESTTYAWDRHDALTRAWHRLGSDCQIWHYHFARPGNPAGQARWFLAHVLPVYRRGDRLVADIEVPGVNGRWVDSFWAAVDKHKAAGSIPKEDYGSPYFLRDHGVRPHHEEGLWLADYASQIAFLPTGWSHYDAWQYTDRARAAGAAAPVDQSRLSGGAKAAKASPRKQTALQHIGEDRKVAKRLERRTHKVGRGRAVLERLLAAVKHALAA